MQCNTQANTTIQLAGLTQKEDFSLRLVGGVTPGGKPDRTRDEEQLIGNMKENVEQGRIEEEGELELGIMEDGR